MDNSVITDLRPEQRAEATTRSNGSGTAPAHHREVSRVHLDRPAVRSAREHRQSRLSRNIFLSDLAIICVCVVAGQLIRFADHAPSVPVNSWASPIGYPLISAALVLLWMAFLALAGSRSPRVLGRGVEEYELVAAATFQLFGLVAIVALLGQLDLSRGYLAIALPMGLCGLLINRAVWRRAAARRRMRGEDRTPLLVVGSREAAVQIAGTFSRDQAAGFEVVAICTPDGSGGHPVVSVDGRDIPVVGADRAIIDVIHGTGVESVALAPTDRLDPTDMRRLMWELDALGVELMVAPGLIDVAEQRLLSRPIAGMAMLTVAKPQYSKANSVAKRYLDVVFASVALLMISPVLVAAAVAVRISSPGPAFYLSERIGLNGSTFRMIKFRSMYVESDSLANKLIALHGGNAMYFKIKDDPRVTPVGRVLRKFSIDELPQFFNVLRGDMSVVGPRPQVRREVDAYDDLMIRRLSVKPGVTGLWQVSGRSDLSIEDSIRLDLSYVENWSMAQDLHIIAKTVPAVLRSSGAY